jgi:hypothetical protein
MTSHIKGSKKAPYGKPTVSRVPLRPEEAVLALPVVQVPPKLIALQGELNASLRHRAKNTHLNDMIALSAGWRSCVRSVDNL